MQKYWGALLVLVILASCKEEKPTPESLEIADIQPSEEVPEATEYGFNLKNFKVLQDTVRNGDSFGELMIENKVDYPKIAKISEEYRDTFDVRKIRVGKPYLILKSKDTLEAAQVFIYQNDPINYTVVDFRDTAIAYKEQREVKYVEREASGVIPQGGNLSDIIVKNNIDYMMVHNLSEIYAWTIDFFKLEAGDKFKIIYKEKYINDSIYAGAGHIESAYFEHRGTPFLCLCPS